jgi:hypothetical protein
MLKIFLTICLFVFSQSAVAADYTLNDLSRGVWRGTTNGKRVMLSVSQSGRWNLVNLAGSADEPEYASQTLASGALAQIAEQTFEVPNVNALIKATFLVLEPEQNNKTTIVLHFDSDEDGDSLVGTIDDIESVRLFFVANAVNPNLDRP